MTAPRPRTDCITVTLHWALVVAITAAFLTGMAVSADAEDAGWSRALRPFLLQGEIVSWHVWISVVLTSIAVAYLTFLIRARLTTRLVVKRSWVTRLRSGSRNTRMRAINRVLYWLSFALLLGMATTGLLLYAELGLLPHAFVSTTHRLFAWSFVVFVPLHVLAQLAMGGMSRLLSIVNPRLAYGAVGFTAICAGAASVAAVTALDSASKGSLKLAPIAPATAPLIDGKSDDRAWARARPVTVYTTRGANFSGGEVPITVRGLHDGEVAYFLFEWPDSTRSQKHLPVIKTERGWRVLQNQYGIQDEDDYYEDKFGVMLSRSPSIAGGTIHLGPEPLKGKPGAFGGRGLHYTTDGSVVDVWHWKSIRTGSFGMIDDDHFGPPLQPTERQVKGTSRYTGGYTQDPKTSGGYTMNWKKFDGDIVQLRFLPRTPELVRLPGVASIDPKVSDDGQWWLPASHLMPYDEALDQYPVGTVMPSVIIDGPFQGDRGDVLAGAEWSGGRWRLEVKRKLDTGSKFDLPIDNNIYLWVAAFDHSQTRHSRHLHPLRIELGR